MATRDEPLDPQEVLAAAEAAHLAARHTVPISQDQPGARDSPRARESPGSRDSEDSRTEPGEPADAVRDRAGPAGSGQREPVRAFRNAASRAPLPLAAVVAAGWAALVSFAPVALLVLAVQAAEGGPLAVAGPARVAAAGWLLAHGVPLQTPAGPVVLVPLALSALAAWRVARAGVHVTRAIGVRGRGSPRQALVAAVAVGIAYAGIGALAGLLAGGPQWGPSVPRAALTLAGFGIVAAGYGSLRATGVLSAWVQRLPRVLRDGVRAGAIAALLLLGAGAAVAGVAVAASGGAAADIIAAYRTNVPGQAGLTLVCLAYAPNLATWAAAYLAGPGFAVGTDTVVRSSEVTIGPLPGVPVFAGLPDGPLPTVGALLLVIPIATGVVCGWLLARWSSGWLRPLLGAAIAGVVAGGLLAAAVLASGGSLGTGQLARFGAEPGLVAGFSTATVTGGAVLGAVAATALASSASRLRQRRG